MQHNQAIFEFLFKRNFSDPGNKYFLEGITETHPYFSPAQFYLLLQTEKGSAAFEKQAARTNILFNNPYWLNFQLQQPKEDIPVVEKPVALPDMKIETGERTEEVDENEIEIEPMKLELKMPEEKNLLENMPFFEPMHMVDYFASQGIKLSEDPLSSDKLGKQLKSFTEWLRIMKKVHGENVPETTGHSDATIQNLAEKSNTEDEVLTVSMADVLARQGKTSKAVEVLQKLSLLNPDKSAYFAAKIEYLKGL